MCPHPCPPSLWCLPGASTPRVLIAGLCPQPVSQEVQLSSRMGVGLLDSIALVLSLGPMGGCGPEITVTLLLLLTSEN